MAAKKSYCTKVYICVQK